MIEGPEVTIAIAKADGWWSRKDSKWPQNVRTDVALPRWRVAGEDGGARNVHGLPRRRRGCWTPVKRPCQPTCLLNRARRRQIESAEEDDPKPKKKRAKRTKAAEPSQEPPTEAQPAAEVMEQTNATGIHSSGTHDRTGGSAIRTKEVQFPILGNRREGMKFEINHLLGIDSAEVQVAPGEIVEVVGPNASGKTSFAVIVQALAGRNANPLGLSIGDARKTYLHKGDEDGFGRLTLDNPTDRQSYDADQVEWIPRNATMTAPTSGESSEPLSWPEAVGLVDFVGRQSDKARAAMLQPVLLPSAGRGSGQTEGAAKGQDAGAGPSGRHEVHRGPRMG